MKLQGIIHGILATRFSLLIIISSSSFPFVTSQGLKLPYMTSNVGEVAGGYYDYIIVGGGASGCPIATTLTERFSILLVERGGSPYGDPNLSESKNYGISLMQNNEFTSPAQSFVSEEGVTNHRGRVLGGSTAINSGFYSRASEDFIQRVGWDRKLVRDAYEWIESKMVFKPPKLSKWQSTFNDALVEEGGLLPSNGFNLEHVAGTKVGGSIFDGTGRRHMAADLLGAGKLERITILLYSTVKNVIFSDNGDGRKPRVTGIRFIKSDGGAGETYEAYLKQEKESGTWGEVILSAGALGSPQILMLSGIGPKEHLQHLGISTLIDATGVGEDIKDNPSFSLLLDSPQSLKPDSPHIVGVTHDYQIIIQSVIRYATSNETTLRIGAKLAYPVSRGKLKLKNTDPRENPSVRFNYLLEDKDLDGCVKMGNLVEGVARANAVKLYLGNQHHEIVQQSREELREYCKNNVKTFYHYHGGCGVGSVIDEEYKVYGVEGLRVVDGSTLPDAPGTNPMATLLMLGRYQGIKMLMERNATGMTWFPEVKSNLFATHI